MKKLIKQFRLPFKSTSPNLKKKPTQEPAQVPRSALSTNKTHKKKQPTVNKPQLKINTETGTVIKKVTRVLFRKKQPKLKLKKELFTLIEKTPKQTIYVVRRQRKS